jgi:hypothetical protein
MSEKTLKEELHNQSFYSTIDQPTANPSLTPLGINQKEEFLTSLDFYDKVYSSKMHRLVLPNFEPFLVIFGLLFNRAYCFISIALSGIYAFYYPSLVLRLVSRENFFALENSPHKLALVFSGFNLLMLLLVLLTTQTMKKTLKR